MEGRRCGGTRSSKCKGRGGVSKGESKVNGRVRSLTSNETKENASKFSKVQKAFHRSERFHSDTFFVTRRYQIAINFKNIYKKIV